MCHLKKPVSQKWDQKSGYQTEEGRKKGRAGEIGQ